MIVLNSSVNKQMNEIDSIDRAEGAWVESSSLDVSSDSTCSSVASVQPIQTREVLYAESGVYLPLHIPTRSHS